MAATAIQGFTQFVAETGPLLLTGTESTVNDAQGNNFNTMGYLARGQQMSDIVQGGSEIIDEIYLSATRRAREYQEMEDQAYATVTSGTVHHTPWRTWMTDIVIPEKLIELNAGAQFSAEHRAQQYKNIWFRKQQECYTDAWMFEEENAWAPPNKLTMEASTGRSQYSIPCFVNEFDNGLPSAAHVGGAWTTVMGIDPTAAGQTNWVPQRFAYDNNRASNHASFGATDLLAVFDRAWMKLGFRPPPHDKQYFETATAKPINVIFTSLQGRLNLLKTYRISQDRGENASDPFMNPMYAGAPLVYVSHLDTAAIFPTGAAAALSTELDTAGATNAGPRYFLIQPEYLRKVYFKDRSMKMTGEMRDVRQPFTLIYPIDNLCNLIARSRKRHGIIYPTADIT
jgi:hypothetical protein